MCRCLLFLHLDIQESGLVSLRHVRDVWPKRATDFKGSPFCKLQADSSFDLSLDWPIIAMLTKEPEMLQPGVFCEHTMQ